MTNHSIETLPLRQGRPIKSLIGQTFGLLTVLEFSHTNRYGGAVWKCRCKCGKIKERTSAALKWHRIKSCGCLDSNKKKVSIIGLKGECKNTAIRAVYRNYLRNASKASREFSLTFDDFIAITSRHCAYCGLPPSNSTRVRSHLFVYSGIDRVDNDKGYELSNVVPCCSQCNRAKHSQSKEQFHSYIGRLIEHNIWFPTKAAA